MRALVLSLFAIAGALCAGCVIQPMQLRTVQPSGQPVDGASVYRNTLGWFKILASDDQPFATSPDGIADFTLWSRRTSLTVFKPGFEPRQVIVMPYRGVRTELRGEGETTLDFDQITSKVPVDLTLTPVTRTPMTVRVVGVNGEPISGAVVFASTFIYLKKVGAEESRGRLPVQQVVTGIDGAATVDFVSGFLNRIVVRAPGRLSTEVELRQPSSELEVAALPREERMVQFVVRDRKTKKPVEGVVLSVGSMRDGLPSESDAFTRPTRADGTTEPVLMARRVPLYVQVKAPPGFKHTDLHLDWRAMLADPAPVFEARVWLEPK